MFFICLCCFYLIYDFYFFFFFFFQAEDGIRDRNVTGVQTCALPIFLLAADDPASAVYVGGKQKACAEVGMAAFDIRLPADAAAEDVAAELQRLNQIGRASCRERV